MPGICYLNGGPKKKYVVYLSLLHPFQVPVGHSGDYTLGTVRDGEVVFRRRQHAEEMGSILGKQTIGDDCS